MGDNPGSAIRLPLIVYLPGAGYFREDGYAPARAIRWTMPRNSEVSMRGDDVADDEVAVCAVIGDLLIGQDAGHKGLAMWYQCEVVEPNVGWNLRGQ